MRQGFTLIELMIVIAIIAVIAAIAIPNLLESRVSSQESAAAASLKSGLLPAQVQFQGGSYCDQDNDGVGTYAVVGINGSGSASYTRATNPYDVMSGLTTTPGGVTLTLLPPTYRSATSATGTASTPTISAYNMGQPISASGQEPASASDGLAEQVWAASSEPTDINNGRRGFVINQAGNVYSSKPSNTLANHQIAGGMSATSVFGTSLTGAPASTLYIPYRR